MPANGLASSAKRTAGEGPTCAGSASRPIAATTAPVSDGAIHRATAPAAENVTPGKLVLQNVERQSTTADGEGRTRTCLTGRLQVGSAHIFCVEIGACAG